jgi:hypothetical protein
MEGFGMDGMDWHGQAVGHIRCSLLNGMVCDADVETKDGNISHLNIRLVSSVANHNHTS